MTGPGRRLQPGGLGLFDGQVIFQGQYAQCGGQGQTLVEQLPDPGGEGELAAGVAAAAAS